MISGRCAACKYLRRRCPSDCIFSPYFPPNDHQRFACVHRIYGASNVGKMLQQIPSHDLRAKAADTLYFEAKYRIQDPVYGCVGMITQLHQQIHNAESELAKTQAQIAFLNSNDHAQESQVQNIETKLHPDSNILILPEQINAAGGLWSYVPASATSTDQTSWF
ncbi:hypothetical protein F2P56_021874 [Juglans regia]|uniref:LOB domain-containing protein n=2 Tax=Juglans regia TaxID=51240 RepID=A0A833X4D9_JUGRE|nr:LOB domain-containing protein 24-like [Juglans regia]KAF5457796.1 hypothetical protein F2P56_021874 [Juglans regia]